MADSTKRWLRVKEAAEQVGVTERTFREYIAEGLVPAYRIGTHTIRIRQEDLDNVLLRPIPTMTPEDAA